MQISMSLNKTNNSAQMAEKQAQRRTYFKGGETRNGLVEANSQMSSNKEIGAIVGTKMNNNKNMAQGSKGQPPLSKKNST
jgi:hypothetical protein